MSSKPSPRNIPTLTEVVPPQQPPALYTAALDADAITQEVVKALNPLLERELLKAVQQQVQIQTQALLPQLREQVRLAVHDAMAQLLEAPRNGPENRLE